RQGIVFLPNHPAEIDPVMVYMLLAGKFAPHPLVVEHFYYLKGARFFMDTIGALPLPNFELSMNSWKIGQVEKSLKAVREGIGRGENFLIYPSGNLKQEGHENIGGNSFIHRILETCPEVKVVLVRTTGLWGSLFSRAPTGRSPDFWHGIWRGFLIAFKNGIFFTPKRKVTLTFEEAGKDFPFKGTRLELNQYLEQWYNRYPGKGGEVLTSEPLNLVSFSRFKHEVPRIALLDKKEKPKKELNVPSDVREEVERELSRLSGKKSFQESDNLSRDLGLDSLDLASVHAFLDHRFGASVSRPGLLRSVYDLYEVILEGNEEEPKEEEAPPKKSKWPSELSRPSVRLPEGKTIPEAFLKTAMRMGKCAACADGMTPVLSYKKLGLAVRLLTKKFESVEGKYVAVLLPSSVGCYLVILALQFAGKIPVLLNWTAGERSLKFAKELLNFQTIFSSRRFLERVDVLELGPLEEDLVLMEDFRKQISLFDKIGAVFSSLKAPDLNENDPAVILFTSGTENYPKAVPLSHRNILINQRDALSFAGVYKDDLLYGVLPPFHSFGFSVTGLLPLLSGLRVYYAPDPTDTHGMARDCQTQKVTLLCCAPSFYRNLFRVATVPQLKSVRLFVSGAEKAPPELFEHVKRLGGKKEMIEGYGITECSPIVTLNSQGEPPQGVGKPLPHVELCVIHPENQRVLKEGDLGEVCISGPNVFQGYLGSETADPFIELEGKSWYRSGDLGRISPGGHLFLEGRIKRFVKIGGEMVSLVSLEETLTQFGRKEGRIKEEAETPQVAIGVKEGERPELILFTTFDVTKEEANEVLKSEGFARIVKIAASHKLKEIPITGTGKIQMRSIKQLVEENSETL
ncbi:MAG: AMP-binding protein, partial [Chlamydiia bacterium]|nr:AMP-binding protein [Chlamydiia bacterium]